MTAEGPGLQAGEEVNEPVYATNVIRLLPSPEEEGVLRLLADRAAALYNAVQYHCRQAFFSRQPVPSYGELCKVFKEHPAYRALPSHIGQEIIKKARKAWDAYFACRRLCKEGKLEHAPRIPGYWKDRKSGQRTLRLIPVKSTNAYSLDTHTLQLTLPADIRRRPGDRLQVCTRGMLRYTGEAKTLEIRYDRVQRRWYAHQAVKRPEFSQNHRPGRAAADLGARVLVALAVEGRDRPLLFSGREVWKEFRYWTKRISQEQARLSKAGRKTSRTLSRLYQRRARRLKHAFIVLRTTRSVIALAARVARLLRRQGVGVLYLEDLTGIREDMDFGPGNLLVHNFWAFRMLRNCLERACSRKGIKVEKLPPCGTSSRCAVCGEKVERRERHKATCKTCNQTWHADANAALNLLGSSKGHGVEATPQRPPALRWNRHRWVSRRESAVENGHPRAIAA